MTDKDSMSKKKSRHDLQIGEIINFSDLFEETQTLIID